MAVNARTPPQILGWSSHKSLWKRSEFSCFHRESLLKNWFCASSPLWQREGWSERKIEIYLILIHLYWLLLNDPRDWFSEGGSGQRAGVGPVIRARRDQIGGIKDIQLDHSVLNSRKKTFLRMAFSEKKWQKVEKDLGNEIKNCVMCAHGKWGVVNINNVIILNHINLYTSGFEVSGAAAEQTKFKYFCCPHKPWGIQWRRNKEWEGSMA